MSLSLNEALSIAARPSWIGFVRVQSLECFEVIADFERAIFERASESILYVNGFDPRPGKINPLGSLDNWFDVFILF